MTLKPPGRVNPNTHQSHINMQPIFIYFFTCKLITDIVRLVRPGFLILNDFFIKIVYWNDLDNAVTCV